MPKKQSKNYTITYHVSKAAKDMKTVMENHFLKYIQKIQQSNQTRCK